MLNCHIIVGSPTGAEVVLLHKNLITITTIKRLVEEDHLRRSILKCDKCEQIYFYEYLEERAWLDPEIDPVYKTYIPVNTVEEAEKLNEKSSVELSDIFPRLVDDLTANGTRILKWLN